MSLTVEAAEGAFTAEEQALFEKLNIGKEGGVPLPSFIRPDEVVAQSRPLAESIFEHWRALADMMEKNEGAMLYERWKRLKKKRRRGMLAQAWGGDHGMARHHRPDLAAWHNSNSNLERARGGGWTETDREAFMWPHINLEDLGDTPRPLWLLLKSRGSRGDGPDVFAAADLETTRLGKACLALMPRYLNRYSMLFAGRSTPDTYGQLYPWDGLPTAAAGGDDDDDGPLSTFERTGTHPGEGLWILAIQARLYRFLLDMATGILGGTAGAAVTEERLPDGPAAAAAAAAAATATDMLSSEDLPAAMAELPYTTYPRGPMRLQTILDLTCAKLWEAEDKLRAMRSGPTDLAAAVRAGQKPPPANASTAAVAGQPPLDQVLSCIQRALQQLETWNILYAKAQLVAQQMEKHVSAAAAKASAAEGWTAAAAAAAQGLPRELILALLSLRRHLQAFEEDEAQALDQAAAAAPSSSGTTADTTEPDGTRPLLESSSRSSEIAWLLSSLQEVSKRQLLGSQTLLDGLERELRGSTGAADDNEDTAKPVSPAVAAHIGAMGVFALCEAELDRFPAELLDDDDNSNSNGARNVLDMDLHMSLSRLRRVAELDMGGAKPQLAKDLNGQWFPGGELVGQEEEDRQARDNAFETLWTCVVEALNRAKALKPRLREVLLVQDGERPNGVADAGNRPRSRKLQTVLKVDKRSHKVFRALFHHTSNNTTAPQITWLDVVHAMRAARFSATKLYGSAWLFSPTAKKSAAAAARGQDLMRPTWFDEPWTTQKMSPEMARHMGTRLARAYGWGIDTFQAE